MIHDVFFRVTLCLLLSSLSLFLFSPSLCSLSGSFGFGSLWSVWCSPLPPGVHLFSAFSLRVLAVLHHLYVLVLQSHPPGALVQAPFRQLVLPLPRLLHLVLVVFLLLLHIPLAHSGTLRCTLLLWSGLAGSSVCSVSFLFLSLSISFPLLSFSRSLSPYLPLLCLLLSSLSPLLSFSSLLFLRSFSPLFLCALRPSPILLAWPGAGDGTRPRAARRRGPGLYRREMYVRVCGKNCNACASTTSDATCKLSFLFLFRFPFLCLCVYVCLCVSVCVCVCLRVALFRFSVPWVMRTRSWMAVHSARFNRRSRSLRGELKRLDWKLPEAWKARHVTELRGKRQRLAILNS